MLRWNACSLAALFPPRLLTRLEEHLEHPIGHYFDLISGTPTGGIIAIGLGLGLSARDIFTLYGEQGPAILGQQHSALQNWVRQKARGIAHLFVSQVLVRAAAPLVGGSAWPDDGWEKAAHGW